jgi:hypothetical protein
MSRDLEQIVDLAGLEPGELTRLRRVHDLLVVAGPPAELPAALLSPPEAPVADVVSLASRRRRPAAVVLIAAAVAAACFGTGYVIANEVHTGSPRAAEVVSLSGQQNSFASLRVSPADSNGNWPVQLTVTGLPQLSNSARYVLMLWKNGKPSSLCGMFEVGKSGTTTVSFSVPYAITKSTRFVVTEMVPGVNFPGQVVMTSS